MMRGGRNFLLGALLLLSWGASAQGEKVDVMAEVVLASNRDATIDPPTLSAMKDKFKAAGLTYSSYRRLHSQTLSLSKGQPASLALPNGRKVSLKLEDIKDGTAFVQLDIPKLVKVTVSLGREGSVFQDAGAHDGGKLVLVLSAPAK